MSPHPAPAPPCWDDKHPTSYPGFSMWILEREPRSSPLQSNNCLFVCLFVTSQLYYSILKQSHQEEGRNSGAAEGKLEVTKLEEQKLESQGPLHSRNKEENNCGEEECLSLQHSSSCSGLCRFPGPYFSVRQLLLSHHCSL